MGPGPDRGSGDAALERLDLRGREGDPHTRLVRSPGGVAIRVDTPSTGGSHRLRRLRLPAPSGERAEQPASALLLLLRTLVLLLGRRVLATGKTARAVVAGREDRRGRRAFVCV